MRTEIKYDSIIFITCNCNLNILIYLLNFYVTFNFLKYFPYTYSKTRFLYKTSEKNLKLSIKNITNSKNADIGIVPLLSIYTGCDLQLGYSTIYLSDAGLFKHSCPSESKQAFFNADSIIPLSIGPISF